MAKRQCRSHGGSGSRPSARVSPQDAPPRDNGGPSPPRRHEPRPGARPCRRPSPGLRTAGRRDVRSRAPCRAEAELGCLSAAGRQGTATGHAVSPDGWRRLSDCGRCGRCPSHLANPVQAASGCPCPPAGLTRPVRASRSTGGPVGSGATVDRHGRSLVRSAAQGPEGPPWDRAGSRSAPSPRRGQASADPGPKAGQDVGRRHFRTPFQRYAGTEWCPGAESNHRHEDFQSTALPLSYPGTGNAGGVRVRAS